MTQSGFQLFSRHPPWCIFVCKLYSWSEKVSGKLMWLTGVLNALDFGSRFNQTLVHRASVERRLQSLELRIPIEKTPTGDPIVSPWQKAEHWEAERYSGDQHSNRSLCMDGQP